MWTEEKRGFIGYQIGVKKGGLLTLVLDIHQHMGVPPPQGKRSFLQVAQIRRKV